MAFLQPPPTLGNQYDNDRVLRSYLRRVVPDKVLQAIEPGLREMGALAGGPLYTLQLDDRRQEPALTQWDAWGERVDRITVTRLWEKAEHLAAKYGLVATAYEQKHGALSRIHQFALAYLFIPSTDLYAASLAMTDGAARTLLASGNSDLILDAVPHLTSRNPEHFWTSGQWMNESSRDTSRHEQEIVARVDETGSWRLYGRVRFTSAVTAPIALALARPEDNASDAEGLALFYIELRDEQGRLQQIRIDRLRDKLGTRKLPTAELTLDGTPAHLVGAPNNGVRALAPLLHITRTWNAVCAVSLMRRGLALARDYARNRMASGASLSRHPLHADTLAGVQAMYEGAFHLTYRIVELLGASEANDFSEDQHGTRSSLLRVLIPLTKLTTAKQAVAALSEVLEVFGGAGYTEDTGLPLLLRDAQALPLWEGTTHTLALDVLQALQEEGGLDGLREEILRCAEAVSDPVLLKMVDHAQQLLQDAEQWLADTTVHGRAVVEAGARRFALALGRALEIALLARHAQWSLEQEQDARAASAAHRLVTDADGLVAPALDASYALANDTPLPATGDGVDTLPQITVSQVSSRTERGNGASSG